VVGRMVAEIHLEPDSAMVVVASAELFVTVAEIVAVVDVMVDVRVVDEKIGEMVDEVVDAECVVVDEMIDVVVVVDAMVVDAVGAMLGEAFDEQDIQKEPALEGRRFPVMPVVDHYLVDTFVLKQTVYLLADCFEHKYCLHSQRKY